MASTFFSKYFANFNANTVDGTYLPFSIAFIVCLLTEISFASSYWDIFFIALKTFKLFVILIGFI